MKASELPTETTLLGSDYALCNAVVAGVETTIKIAWSDLITVLGLGGGGAITAVKSVTSTALQSVTSVNGSWTDLTGLSITYTPTNSAHKILVRCVINVGTIGSQNSCAIRLVRGSTAIGVGAASGSRTVAGATSYSPISDTMFTLISEVLDVPATTSSTTWKVQATCLTGSTGTSTINSSFTNSNTSTYPLTASTLTIMEINS